MIRAGIMNHARVILLIADGANVNAIAGKAGLNRNSVLLCMCGSKVTFA